MAGIIEEHSDLKNHRVFSMWAEAGIQFRSNVVTEVGGCVPLHSHSYDHMAICTQGKFRCEVDQESFEVTAGSKIFIGMGKQHTFTLLEAAPGEILCLWPIHKA
jgi:quercetin dioxygenase-like cupin family protein